MQKTGLEMGLVVIEGYPYLTVAPTCMDEK